MMKRKLTAFEKISYLKDFVTDGCTMAPDLEFSECCDTHDLDYSTTDTTRAQADRRLRQCIHKKGYPFLSIVYWIGVRLMGWFAYYYGSAYDFRQEYIAGRNMEKDI